MPSETIKNTQITSVKVRNDFLLEMSVVPARGGATHNAVTNSADASRNRRKSHEISPAVTLNATIVNRAIEQTKRIGR